MIRPPLRPRTSPGTSSRTSRPRAIVVLAVVVAMVGAIATAGGFGPGLGRADAAATVPGLPNYPEYWFPQWNVPAIWGSGDRGQGVTVAVIDTGVQASVADLSGSVLPGTDLTGLGGDGHTDRDRDNFDHGTAMAALIAGHGGRFLAGVAPLTKILPVAVPLVGTNQGAHSPDYISTAVRYAAAHGANIISMSLGGLRYADQENVACPADTQAAIFYALSKGAIVVAAGGNAGLKGSPTEEPGVCLGVVSVAAVDAKRHPAKFSSRHAYLTVAAPGVNIPTINAKDVIFIGDGTSQATALTSGALALMWAAHRTETNRQITARLMAGVQDAGSPGPDPVYGYGTIDPSTSIAATLGPHAVNPVFTRADPFLVVRGPAAAKALARPPVTTARPPTAFAREQPPATGIDRLTWAGAGVALLGLVVLIGLTLSGRRRRLHRRQPGYGLPLAGAVWTGPPADPAPPPPAR